MKKTMSKQYPAIQRLQGCILFPDDIEAVQVSDEQGGTETHYKYNLVRVSELGQDLSDYTAFKVANYAELRRKTPYPRGYGSQEQQFELQHEQGFVAWQDHCAAVKANFPKPA